MSFVAPVVKTGHVKTDYLKKQLAGLVGFSLARALVLAGALLAQGVFAETAINASTLASSNLADVGSINRVVSNVSTKHDAKSAAVFAESYAQISDVMSNAWQVAQANDKLVMVVLGDNHCDRCLLLDKYLADKTLKARIEKHFVVINISIHAFDQSGTLRREGESATGKAASQQMEYDSPAIVVMESPESLGSAVADDGLLTFMPAPYEPLYDWMENLLFYSEQVLSANLSFIGGDDLQG